MSSALVQGYRMIRLALKGLAFHWISPAQVPLVGTGQGLKV